MNVNKILRYLFHSHKWKLVSNDKYNIIEKEKEMILGQSVGNISVIRFKCKICPAKLEIKYDEEIKIAE